MGRIRTIKPELALHEGLFNIEQRLGMPVRFFWAMLPTVCDREGRFKWRARALKALLLPYDDDVDVEAMLTALRDAGQVIQYEAHGDLYGCIPTWDKHQKVNHREAASQIPDVSEADSKIVSGPDTPARLGTPGHTQARPARPDTTPGQEKDQTRGEEAARGEGKGREGKGREGVVCSEPQISPAAGDEARFCVDDADEGEVAAASGDPPDKPPPQPAVIELPIKGGQKACPIDQETYDRWVEAYDPVDVRQSLVNLREWLLANPQRLSTTPRGTRARAVNWLKNDHERAIRAGPGKRQPAVASGNDPRSKFDDIFGSRN